MKNTTRKALLSAAVLLLLAATGCSKQKTCRCSVMSTDRIRIIKIEKGECDQIHTLQYHDYLDNLHVDSLLCTDYEFLIDSIYAE